MDGKGVAAGSDGNSAEGAPASTPKFTLAQLTRVIGDRAKRIKTSEDKPGTSEKSAAKSGSSSALSTVLETLASRMSAGEIPKPRSTDGKFAPIATTREAAIAKVLDDVPSHLQSAVIDAFKAIAGDSDETVSKYKEEASKLKAVAEAKAAEAAQLAQRLAETEEKNGTLEQLVGNIVDDTRQKLEAGLKQLNPEFTQEELAEAADHIQGGGLPAINFVTNLLLIATNAGEAQAQHHPGDGHVLV